MKTTSEKIAEGYYTPKSKKGTAKYKKEKEELYNKFKQDALKDTNLVDYPRCDKIFFWAEQRVSSIDDLDDILTELLNIKVMLDDLIS